MCVRGRARVGCASAVLGCATTTVGRRLKSRVLSRIVSLGLSFSAPLSSALLNCCHMLHPPRCRCDRRRSVGSALGLVGLVTPPWSASGANLGFHRCSLVCPSLVSSPHFFGWRNGMGWDMGAELAACSENGMGCDPRRGKGSDPRRPAHGFRHGDGRIDAGVNLPPSRSVNGNFDGTDWIYM